MTAENAFRPSLEPGKRDVPEPASPSEFPCSWGFLPMTVTGKFPDGIVAKIDVSGIT